MSGSRIGILGGTFNPPHLGHMIFAQEAWWQLGLEQVVFMPAGIPPHREVEDDVGAEIRFEMCRLSSEGDDRFSVSRHEVDKPATAYTSETLAELAGTGGLEGTSTAAAEAGRRGAGGSASGGESRQIFFLVGGDEARDLPEWHEPEQVLSLATVVVAERDEHRRAEVLDRMRPLAGGERVRFLDMPQVGISSTMVRERVAAGRPIDYLVPVPVARLIAARHLYRG